jgi:hypothetical protein
MPKLLSRGPSLPGSSCWSAELRSGVCSDLSQPKRLRARRFALSDFIDIPPFDLFHRIRRLQLLPSHPCISPILLSFVPSHTDNSSCIYLVSELYATGGSCRPTYQVLAVLSALCALHDQGIAHGRLTHSNIICANDFVVKVVDFGLADLLRNSTKPVDSLFDDDMERFTNYASELTRDNFFRELQGVSAREMLDVVAAHLHSDCDGLKAIRAYGCFRSLSNGTLAFAHSLAGETERLSEREKEAKRLIHERKERLNEERLLQWKRYGTLAEDIERLKRQEAELGKELDGHESTKEITQLRKQAFKIEGRLLSLNEYGAIQFDPAALWPKGVLRALSKSFVSPFQVRLSSNNLDSLLCEDSSDCFMFGPREDGAIELLFDEPVKITSFLIKTADCFQFGALRIFGADTSECGRRPNHSGGQNRELFAGDLLTLRLAGNEVEIRLEYPRPFTVYRFMRGTAREMEPDIALVRGIAFHRDGGRDGFEWDGPERGMRPGLASRWFASDYFWKTAPRRLSTLSTLAADSAAARQFIEIRLNAHQLRPTGCTIMFEPWMDPDPTCELEGSVDGRSWVELGTIKASEPRGMIRFIPVSALVPFPYFRLTRVDQPGARLSIVHFELYGTLVKTLGPALRSRGTVMGA